MNVDVSVGWVFNRSAGVGAVGVVVDEVYIGVGDGLD